MSEHSLVMGLHVQIDTLIESLEKQCFNPKVPPEATRDARVRRLQLIDIREYLLGQKAKL